jgi:carbon-monoxide dehydrogenase medium subunit
MKPAPFEYKAPNSLEEALTNLRDHAEDARLLAGGQSLVPTMNFRVVQPSILIDLNRVHELQFIRQDDQGTLRIGSMTRERSLEIDPQIAKTAPLLAEAMPHVAHPQIRNRGTLGGSLANADPAAELPVIMLALGARLKACNARSERWLDASDFFTGMFTTALVSDEILVEIEIPPLQKRTGWSFMEVAPRAGDYALMGVAALVTLDENERCQQARLVYLNAGDGPVNALEAAKSMEGEFINENVIEAASALASQKEINPFGNVHASPDFQRHLAHVLTRRALKQAMERSKQDRLQ